MTRSLNKSEDPQEKFRNPVPSYNLATKLEEYYDASGTGYYVAEQFHEWASNLSRTRSQLTLATRQQNWLSDNIHEPRELRNVTMVAVLHKNRETRLKSTFPQKGDRHLVLVDPRNNRRLVVNKVTSSRRSHRLRGSTGAVVFSSVQVMRPTANESL